MMQAMRKGTPVKAAAVLGLPGTMITSREGGYLATPTKPRTIHTTPAGPGDAKVHTPAQDMRLDMLGNQYGQSSSTPSAIEPTDLAAKRPFHLVGKNSD